MKKLFKAIMAFLMMILSLFGIGRGQETTVEDVSYKVNGDSVVFSMFSNPSTGYSWVYELDGDSVIFVKEEFDAIETSPQVAGAGGTAHFTFAAAHDGTTTITFTYLRSWEPDPENDRTLTAVVVVTDGAVEVQSLTGVK